MCLENYVESNVLLGVKTRRKCVSNFNLSISKMLKALFSKGQMKDNTFVWMIGRFWISYTRIKMEPLLKKGKEKRRSKELCPTTVTLECIYFLY